MRGVRLRPMRYVFSSGSIIVGRVWMLVNIASLQVTIGKVDDENPIKNLNQSERWKRSTERYIDPYRGGHFCVSTSQID